jgi:hypothetical protein
MGFNSGFKGLIPVTTPDQKNKECGVWRWETEISLVFAQQAVRDVDNLL